MLTYLTARAAFDADGEIDLPPLTSCMTIEDLISRITGIPSPSRDDTLDHATCLDLVDEAQIVGVI